jgi:N-acetylmuramoyl-L-alanine amidase
MMAQYNPQDMVRLTLRVAIAVALLVTIFLVAGCAQKVVVPDVSKMTLEQATSLLDAKGLNPKVRASLPHDTIPNGSVTAQDPPPGTELKKGQEVGLTLSTGPQGFALPDFRNLQLEDVKKQLQEMGLQFKVTKVIDPTRPGTVLNQVPAPQSAVVPDQLIELTVAVVAPDPLPDQPSSSTATTKTAAKPKPSGGTGSTGFVVAIDPGHQAQGDPNDEPIGPGSSTTKDRVTGGAQGDTTGQEESVLNLAVSLKMKAALEKMGVKVVMIRTTQDVNISNSERATKANRAGADFFIRVHADDGSSSSSGSKTLIPGRNQWTSDIYAESSKAGRQFIQPALLKATGFGPDGSGISERTDMTGFNWSDVPTAIIEMGFLSNPTEDRALATDAVRSRVANGVAKAIVDYLKSK